MHQNRVLQDHVHSFYVQHREAQHVQSTCGCLLACYTGHISLHLHTADWGAEREQGSSVYTPMPLLLALPHCRLCAHPWYHVVLATPL